jgi:hypothetical protein
VTPEATFEAFSLIDAFHDSDKYTFMFSSLSISIPYHRINEKSMIILS